MSYLPIVSWKTVIQNVIFISPTEYIIDVTPIDANDPGSNVAIKVGDYIKDHIGNTYTVTVIAINNFPYTVQVVAEFDVVVGPQSEQSAIVYQSVEDGKSPFIAPIRYDTLDKSAEDTSKSIELDILWKHRGFALGVNTNITYISVFGLEPIIVADDGWQGGFSLNLTNPYTNLLSLLDTPNTYVSKGNKLVKVNSLANGIEFELLTSGEVTTALGYTPEDVANKENTILNTSTTKYPTINLLSTELNKKIDTSARGVANGKSVV